ncbi:hypothetical protein NJC38_20740 [Pseudomonas sp. 21LCFQ010]|uniref:FlxA-like family protein n=1 Tax=unclassified Pseudomonas TaxID=196821 RepID=UPI0004F89B0F|nr:MULTISPECIES: FlxA-like family protein [unclassified Pseudomonas]MCO8164569.1 hypothetical protein [Pseudomonas sp. 21LCFQ010]BAP41251.1 putative uncharacterized protein [Pseudomonas sp. StFLB209]
MTTINAGNVSIYNSAYALQSKTQAEKTDSATAETSEPKKLDVSLESVGTPASGGVSTEKLIQQIKKQIEEAQKQLQELQQQLAAAQVSKQSEENKAVQVATIQAQISTVNSQLSTLQGSLLQLVSQGLVNTKA